MALPPVADALRRVLTFLAEQHVDCMVVGGLAVRILALPRSTFDVDVMVSVGEADVAGFARAADTAGFVVDEAFRRGYVDRLAGLAKIHFHLPEATRLVRIDVFVLGSDYQRAAFARRRLADSDLGRLWVVSPEDLLLHKLLADRPRDRSDVADLLLVTGPLERAYLREWAERLDVTERLNEALDRARRQE